jgi:hypothetical protein
MGEDGGFSEKGSSVAALDQSTCRVFTPVHFPVICTLQQGTVRSSRKACQATVVPLDTFRKRLETYPNSPLANPTVGI